MPRRTSRGRCRFCGRSFGKGAMTRHLQTCPQRPGPAVAAPTVKSFHLIVEGREQPEYWLHLAAPATVALQSLDDFLRAIWLECCGHLSSFIIDDTRYEAIPLDDDWADPEEQTMDGELGCYLRDGLRFYHEYDYGATTELVLRVVGIGETDAADLQLLARNDPPDLRCRVCAAPAVRIDPTVWEPADGLLCAACAAKEIAEPDTLLPVVNSPRAGVCNYGTESNE